jgi:hypothetical protein
MDRTYISIGSCCASATLLKNRNLRHNSLPFDWILSHPEFVYNIINKLLEDDLNNVVNEFLELSNLTIHCKPTYGDKINYDGGTQLFEKYVTTEENLGGSVGIYNSKWNVSFPHDFSKDSSVIEKYYRRLERLKNILLDDNQMKCFLYISPSSIDTNYCVNGVTIIKDSTKWIDKLSKFLTSKNINHNIIYLDSINDEKIINENITYYNLTPKENWYPLITENNIPNF